jgi:hypothetical protein
VSLTDVLLLVFGGLAAGVIAKTPTLFEPLACVPGTPAKTRSGTVIVDPPPAIVLLTPAAKPPKTNSKTSVKLTVFSVKNRALNRYL